VIPYLVPLSLESSPVSGERTGLKQGNLISPFCSATALTGVSDCYLSCAAGSTILFSRYVVDSLGTLQLARAVQLDQQPASTREPSHRGASASSIRINELSLFKAIRRACGSLDEITTIYTKADLRIRDLLRSSKNETGSPHFAY
jgi:hypothetical protein